MESHITFNIFAVIAVFACVTSAAQLKKHNHGVMGGVEDCSEQFQGCRLVNGDCECGVVTACVNPYPYLSEHQCRKDLSGELDKCLKEPCENGQCVQVKTTEGYRAWECSCAGSGFHGRRCQHKCPPLDKDAAVPEGYPSACVY